MSKPSKKSMQLAWQIDASIEVNNGFGDIDTTKVAEAIDKHTAEALTEHQRVIEMAEKALTGLVMAYISLCSKHGENFHKCEGSWADHAQHTLDEIAKLRKE